MAVVVVVLAGCATHYIRRAPEAERASFLTRRALKPGMSLSEVIQTAVELRGVGQEVALRSQKSCQPDVRIELGSGSWPQDFATIIVFAEKRLRTHGFSRQRELMRAMAQGEGSMAGCAGAVLAFDARTEGGCGDEAIDLGLDTAGHLTSVGEVYARPSCSE